ncbi:hypothetical protein GCM10010174_90250 [Kutzneria viridogrisea]|uniref:Uncharacterized protein n=2 Tax=Kutzneria TaxID=43356 RepID=W5WGB6_9PSEU|nr:hypothetical protein [Kutzneria albida]AHH99912.1 hypothetical protein KALB_6553 [Kutzneria albida DSM 43870]MBA8925093.1 hypothetical protein [Kutzneria viridogrisea]
MNEYPDLPKAPPIVDPTPPRRRPTALLLVGALVLVAAGVLAVAQWLPSVRADAVGDCYRGDVEQVDSVARIDCGPEAKYKVVGIEKDQSKLGLQLGTACEQSPTADATFWSGREGGTGTVLCLEDLKNPGKRMPAVGECVKGKATQGTDLAKVACGAEADYKVVGIEDAGIVSGLSARCTKFPTSAASAVWTRQNKGLSRDKVLCLEDAKHPGSRNPGVGQCVRVGAEDKMEVVDCASGADAKVVGKIDDTTEIDLLTKRVSEVCKQWPEADRFGFVGFQGSLKGSTLCMATLKR